MVKKIFPEDSPELLVDAFKAVKRALVRGGILRRRMVGQESNSVAAESKRLVDVTRGGHDILFKADTVFPLTPFPGTVTLDREKLTFVNRIFFGVAKIHSIPVRDILSVEADIGPFFGSVHTASRYFITNPYSVDYLWRKDAIGLQRMLQGYIIAFEREIDCTNIGRGALIVLLNDLGSGEAGR